MSCPAHDRLGRLLAMHPGASEGAVEREALKVIREYAELMGEVVAAWREATGERRGAGNGRPRIYGPGEE